MPDTEQRQGKGRPTPKRSEANKGRRQPVVQTRGKGGVKDKATRAEERKQARAAMRGGADERYLPPIARGPERALVRDVVDARRSYAWVALPGWLVGLVVSMIASPVAQAIGSGVLSLVVGILVADSVAAGRAVRRTVTERGGPKEGSLRALTYYGVARNMQPRAWRRPPARVKRGDAI